MGSKHTEESKPSKTKTPTFLLELPLVADVGQAARLCAHLEAGRQFYNAVLSEGQRRLRRMRADPAQAGGPPQEPARANDSQSFRSWRMPVTTNRARKPAVIEKGG